MKTFATIFMYASLLVSIPILALGTILFSFVGIVGQVVLIPLALISIARDEKDFPTPIEMFFVFASVPYSMFSEVYGTTPPKTWS